MENVVVVEEIISNLQKRNINDNVVKVDFIKAFNFVDWDFLFELLEARGFSACWIRQVKTLLFSTKASIILNGTPYGYIWYKKGLQQGDPLSPFLFILVVDVLNTTFTHVLSSKVLYEVSLGNLGQVCHLQYDDDLLILTACGEEDLRVIKLIFYLFEDMSGLAINFHKICHNSTKFNQLPSQEDLQTLNSFLVPC